MEKRQDPEHFFFRRIEVYVPEQHLRYICGQVPLAQHRPFGPAGGSPGVLQHGDIVIEVHGDRVWITGVIDKIGKVHDGRTRIDFGEVFSLEQAKQHALDFRQYCGHRTDDDLFQALGLRKHCSDLGIKHLKIHRDHDLGGAVINLKGEFALNVKRVVIDDCRAGPQRAVIADHGVRCVG